jgi:hypothetical protein
VWLRAAARGQISLRDQVGGGRGRRGQQRGRQRRRGAAARRHIDLTHGTSISALCDATLVMYHPSSPHLNCQSRVQLCARRRARAAAVDACCNPAPYTSISMRSMNQFLPCWCVHCISNLDHDCTTRSLSSCVPRHQGGKLGGHQRRDLGGSSRSVACHVPG